VPKKSKDVQTESANGVCSGVKKAARKKSAAKNLPSRKPSAAKSQLETKPSPPSDEQIRIRAYFLAEKRANHALRGDHHSDWLEARRQLLEEAGLPLH
jgi:hypothetical protein